MSRLFLGGLPAWSCHEDVRQWCWNHNCSPIGIQLVRRHAGETKIIGFAAFSTPTQADKAMQALPNCFYGFRISIKKADESRAMATPHGGKAKGKTPSMNRPDATTQAKASPHGGDGKGTTPSMTSSTPPAQEATMPQQEQGQCKGEGHSQTVLAAPPAKSPFSPSSLPRTPSPTSPASSNKTKLLRSPSPAGSSKTIIPSPVSPLLEAPTIVGALEAAEILGSNHEYNRPTHRFLQGQGPLAVCLIPWL